MTFICWNWKKYNRKIIISPWIYIIANYARTQQFFFKFVNEILSKWTLKWQAKSIIDICLNIFPHQRFHSFSYQLTKLIELCRKPNNNKMKKKSKPTFYFFQFMENDFNFCTQFIINVSINLFTTHYQATTHILGFIFITV